MISNEKGWNYLAVLKLPALLRGITSKKKKKKEKEKINYNAILGNWYIKI